MGHDSRVHFQFYRLQDSTMQLAKISKLLLNIKKGDIKSMTNKHFDQIDIRSNGENLERNELDLPSTNEETFGPEVTSPSQNDDSEIITKKNVDHCNVNDNQAFTRKTAKKVVNRRPWTAKELGCVNSYFRTAITATKKLPGKEEIELFLDIHGSMLNNRTWKDVKYCIYNALKKMITLYMFFTEKKLITFEFCNVNLIHLILLATFITALFNRKTFLTHHNTLISVLYIVLI